MNRAWTIVFAALLVLGCRSESEPAAETAPDSDGHIADQGPSEALGAPVDATEATHEPLPTLGVTTEPGSAPEPEAQAGAPTGPVRDLATELNEAVGTPTECVQDIVAASPTTIRISISATVRPTGRVILPSVHGSGLSDAGRKCIEQRVGQVVLAPLEDSTSQVVATVVEVARQPPAVVEGDTGVPEPELRNVRQPLPPRPEATSAGRQPLPPREEVAPSGRPIQEPTSRKVKGPKPRPIDGHEVDEQAKDWR